MAFVWFRNTDATGTHHCARQRGAGGQQNYAAGAGLLAAVAGRLPFAGVAAPANAQYAAVESAQPEEVEQGWKNRFGNQTCGNVWIIIPVTR